MFEESGMIQIQYLRIYSVIPVIKNYNILQIYPSSKKMFERIRREFRPMNTYDEGLTIFDYSFLL